VTEGSRPPHTALVLGDQLARDNPALDGAARVLFVESLGGLARLRTHRQRVHLVVSAMRRFAAELEAAGVEVVYRRDAASLAEGLDGFDDLVCAHPTSAAAKRLLERRGVRLVAAPQFLVQPEEFAAWAGDRRKLVMEPFYRRQRKRLGVLLQPDGEPEGGRWNLDRDNRRPPRRRPRGRPSRGGRPRTRSTRRSGATSTRSTQRSGATTGPRTWPATPQEAQAALEDFVTQRLAAFGPWQDAILVDRPVLFHSLLSELDEPGPDQPADRRAPGRGGLPRRRHPAAVGRGLRPPGHRLARVHVGQLLAAHRRVARAQRARRPTSTCPTPSGARRPAGTAWTGRSPRCARARTRTTSSG
jgi:deoxyribodipyrimidine photolyase-related protein